MPEPSRRPTLADVAKASGMSKSAVSMILNERPGSRLSPEAAARVRSAAEALGYRPNPAAQSLRWGKTRTIGFISDQVTVTRFASGMIHGALRTARAHDHTVLIAETEGEPGRLEEAIASMLDQRVDGLLVGLMAARLVDLPPVPRDVPLVIINGQTARDDASVLPEEYRAGRRIAEVLLDAGHRRIGIVGDLDDIRDPRVSATIRHRFAGIDDALQAAGASPTRVTVPRWDPTVGYEEALRMLSAHPTLTALIAGNDSAALGIYQAAQELGMTLPSDLSVVSFDDEELAAYLRPGLTTARLPYIEMAQIAMEMILGTRELAHELVPMPLIIRRSVGRPRG
ncbi:MAG TPA: LacI family DNA-binding transcriptional regulator [Arachnia sp.]|nr:LacI family DNA-binding transcriptional regulator [Arachnia sp.]HMT85876.1 LacI family DNA-binding transcriptional regulator [Arachnia sp.]